MACAPWTRKASLKFLSISQHKRQSVTKGFQRRTDINGGQFVVHTKTKDQPIQLVHLQMYFDIHFVQGLHTAQMPESSYKKLGQVFFVLSRQAG